EPENAAWPLAMAHDAAERGDSKAVVEWSGKALALSPRNTEALALRAHAKVERRDYPGAMDDLNALPPSELATRPELSADGLVCLVEMKDGARAQAAGKLVPAELTARSDVARAQKELSGHISNTKEAASMTTGPSTKSASENPGPAPTARANTTAAPPPQ